MSVATPVLCRRSEAMIAAARDDFTLGAYFVFARNVISPGPALSIVDTPRISVRGSPESSQPSRSARSPRVKEGIFRKLGSSSINLLDAIQCPHRSKQH